jgi:aryl-phospho-beta-D-glucosidase BglC (GH1 family)
MRKTTTLSRAAKCGLVGLLLLLPSCATETGTGGTTTPEPEIEKSFIRRSGTQLVVGETDQVIYLRGVNLSYDRVSSDDPSEPWRLADYTDWGTPATGWYQEKHFASIKEIGFNVARLNLTYRIFEDNADPGNWKESGWELIDRLIGWGKKYGLYLILDMHVAPGGAGIVSCMGCGWRTWDEQAYQDRFKALWRAIAERYADETQMAAYDLLNEPAPTESASQWQSLAQALIDEIREVDKNHLIIVEMPVWIFDKNNDSPLGNYDTNVLSSFQFLVNDENVIYDFHYYLPTAFTLQDETGVDGGKYPDEAKSESTIGGTTMPRDKNYLDNEMKAITNFWASQGVPANFGEWGTAVSAIVDSERGGIAYIQDMLGLMDERKMNWQFYYLNRIYRIDCCYDDNPTTPISQPLIDLFKSYFASTR